MLRELDIPIILNEPDCSNIQFSNWYDETNPVSNMENNLGSDAEVTQELLSFTGKTNTDIVVLQFCLGIVIKVKVVDAEVDYANVADGHIVLTTPDSNTFDTTKLNTALPAQLIVMIPATSEDAEVIISTSPFTVTILAPDCSQLVLTATPKRIDTMTVEFGALNVDTTTKAAT